MTVRVMEGHVLDVLRSLPSNTFQCAATSPPYYGLRDYGLPPQIWGGEQHEHEWVDATWRNSRLNDDTAGPKQRTNGGAFMGGDRRERPGAVCACGAWLGNLGLEPTPELFVEHLVSVFREVRRVLRPDGVCWVNLGDSYAGSGKGPPSSLSSLAGSQNPHSFGLNSGSVPSGCKAKDLLGMPWMVAFALRADGWYLRAEIIWSKPNPMPESVTDRPTKAHETVFLLAKSRKYFYDAAAIAEAADADGISEVQSSSGETLLNLWVDSSGDGVLPAEEWPKSGSNLQELRECPRCGLATRGWSGIREGFGSEVQGECEWQSETVGVQPVGEAQAGDQDLRPVAGGTTVSSTLPGFGETEGGPSSVLRVGQGQGGDPPLSADGKGSGVVAAWSSQAPNIARDEQHADGSGVGRDQAGPRLCVCVVSKDGSSTNAGSPRTTVERWAAHQGERGASLSELQQPKRQPTRGQGYGAARGGVNGRTPDRDGGFDRPATGRNKRSVWTVATTPFPGSHFATFPPKLVEPMLLAGSRPGDHVLDPFGGAGTTGLVADRLGRDCTLVELNPVYASMARERIEQDAPLFVDVA